MRLDVAEMKMEYEAARGFYMGFARLMHRAPEELAGVVREAYGNGYEKGLWTSTEFESVDEAAPPVELDWEYEEAWRLGYENGTFSGRLMRQCLLSNLLKQRDLIF